MPSLFLNYQHDTACLYHRFLCPARYCADAMKRVGVDLVVGDGFPDGHDWYAIGGIPGTLDTIMQVARQKRRGAKILWSVDDDWKTIPDWNPAKLTPLGENIHHLMFELADAVLCSTPCLASTYNNFDGPVYVAPNLLEVDRFPRPPQTLEVQPPVRVVWVGGVTHEGDTEFLAEPLDMLLRKLGQDKVAVVFFGAQPPGGLVRDHLHRGLFYQQGVPFASYQQILNSIKPDIYLCPLADIEFNKSKSAIRVMEGWSLMACPVASPVGEYNLVKSGTDGRYANSDGEWVSVLSRLVTDHEYRLTMAVAGRVRVESEFDWQVASCRRPWLEAFSGIMGVECPA